MHLKFRDLDLQTFRLILGKEKLFQTFKQKNMLAVLNGMLKLLLSIKDCKR